MVTVTIFTKDKQLKRIPEVKKLKKKRNQKLPFKEAEKVLHTIFSKMEEQKIKSATFSFDLFFNEKEAETSDILINISPYFPLLEEIIRQDINESEDENTTQLQERQNRELLQEISKELNEPLISNELPTEVAEPKKEIELKEELEPKIQIIAEKREVEPSQENTEKTVEINDEPIDFVIDEEEPSKVKTVENTPGQNKKQRIIDGFENYIQVPVPTEMIAETKHKCSEDQLLELTELVVLEDKEVEKRVKERVLDYLRKKQQNVILVEELKTYEASVKEKINEVTEQLGTYYKEISADKPEKFAEEHLDETFEPIRNRFNLQYAEYEEERNNQTDVQLNKKEEEKQEEIKLALERIETSYQRVMDEVKEKNEQAKNEYKNMCKDELEAERREVYQALLTQKMIENETVLVEGKKAGETALYTSIEAYSLDTLANCQGIIEKVKEEVIDMIPSWEQQALEHKAIRLKEVEEKRKQLENEQLEERRKKELALEEERIALKKKELETPKAPNVQVIPMPMTGTGQSSDTNSQLEELLKTIIAEKKETSQPQKTPVWKTLGISFLCLVALGGVFGFAYENNQTKQQLRATQQELAVQIKSANEPKEETQTLEQLLEGRKFDQAFSQFTDKQSIKQMEAYFVDTEDLPMLKKFNETFPSKTGKLNEAILMKDNKSIIKQYEEMKDKKDLTESEKTAVKLAYFSENKNEQAKKVGT